MTEPAVRVEAARMIGNAEILKQPLTAFFCSNRCPGAIVLQAYDQAQAWRAASQPIVGGFHTPVEKEVLKIMLRSPTPVCVVLARGLPKRVPVEFRKAVDDGRLLMVSAHGPDVKRPTQALAADRNLLVASLAHCIFVAYAASGSKTEAFCRTAITTGKPCQTFDGPHTANLREMGFVVGG